MKPYTAAQTLLLNIGVDPFRLEAHRSETRSPGNKSYSSTKSGPGRQHAQGKRARRD